MKRPIFLSLAMPLACIAACPAGAQGLLTIDVGNIRAAKGVVHVDICPEALFLKDDCPWSGKAPARLGVTRVIITGLPAGRYAAQAFFDENGNGKVDQMLFGIPKEGVGFSNDAKIAFSAPKFAAAVFAFDGKEQIIHLNLRYFMGAKGPPAKR